MIKIAPSILASDFSKLGEEVKRIDEAGCDYVHIDIMDGNFVPNITIGPAIVNALRPFSKKVFDVHLMIEEPIRYIRDFAQSGADIITVHVEGNVHLHKLIQNIKELGVKVAVALNPGTPCQSIESVIKDLDMVLIMTVNPGFGGQAFIDATLDKIRTMRELINRLNPSCDLQVDGGITLENVGEIVAAGANVIVAGSAIFGANDLGEAITKFKQY